MNKCLVALLCAAFPLLVACSGGDPFNPSSAVKYSGYRFTTYTTPADVRAVAGNASYLFAGTGSGLYLGNPTTAEPGFARVTAAGFPVDAVTQRINALLLEASGSLLIGTDNGLYRWNSDGSIGSVNGFAGLKVTALTEKKTSTEKILWVGLSDATAVKTIARQKDDGAFSFYGKANGMTASRTTMIYCDPDSALTIACGTGEAAASGLFQFAESSGFTRLTSPLGDGANFFMKKDDVWYAGGNGSGIVYKSGTNDWAQLATGFTPYGMVDHVADVYRETWVPTNAGVMLYLGMGEPTTFNLANRLTINACSDVEVAHGNVWIAHPASGTVNGGISRAVFTGE